MSNLKILCKVVSDYIIKRSTVYSGIRLKFNHAAFPTESSSSNHHHLDDNGNLPASGKGFLEDLKTTVKDGTGDIIVDRRPRFAFYLSSKAKEAIKDGPSVGKHPGSRKVPAAQLPEELDAAIQIVLEGEDRHLLHSEAHSLTHKILNRQAPMEPAVREQKMKELLHDVISRESVDPDHPEVLEADRQSLLRRRHKLFTRKLRSEVYNYEPMDFSTPRRCKMYMLARLSGDLAALSKAFHQLKKTRVDFKPRTMMDFGSGVGSATWAVDHVWPRSCQEVVNVDSSPAMHALNELLQRGGREEGRLAVRPHATYFRQFLPASGSIKHDLVVMSRTMFELENRDMRLRILDILWKTVAPGGCLVLVEAGHAKACALMLEARQFLLEGVSSVKGSILAPCPHHLVCPLMLKKQKHRICSDSCIYYGISYSQRHIVNEDVFSYIVMQKPKSTDVSASTATGAVDHPPEPSWPRVVQPVLKSSHVLVRVCNKYGNLQELAVCKSRHGTLCSQVAKKCNLGDLFPVDLLPPEQHFEPPVKVYDFMAVKRKTNKLKLSESEETDFKKDS